MAIHKKRQKPKVGTIGCRLHFEDNTIQHDGILLCINNKNVIGVTHHGLRNYFNYNTSLIKRTGSTAALLGIRRNTFINSGMFNEGYINCFEDVELNLKTLTSGYDNYYDGSLVAYHYESQTRNEDQDNIKKLMEDYNHRLFPFINKNWDFLKNHTVKI